MSAPVWVGGGGAYCRDRKRCSTLGYTLIELTLVLVFSSVVMVALYGVLVGQRRFYTSQTEIASTRDAVRIAARVLAGELRDASPVGGDIYAIAPDSIAFRSSRGFGVICSINGRRLQVWLLAGSFGDSEHDSTLVFLEHGFRTLDDDEWRAVPVERVRRPGMGHCPNGRRPDLELVLGREVSGAAIGSPMRAFRPYVYRLYSGGAGRWWLGQRLRSGRLQPVAGPFAQPAAGGLAFEYLDAAGEPTGDPRKPVLVRISLRGRSRGRILRSRAPDFYEDSLSILVYLRNS